MVGSSFVLNSRGVLKKAQFLVVAIVAALAVPIAFPVCLDYGKTQNDWSTVSSFTEAAASSPLPDLSESVAPSPPSAPADQTDNTTAAVTSGGAVKASFTVVSQPAANQEESIAAEGQAMPNNQARTAAHVRPESGGLTLNWGLITSIFSTGIAAISVIAFRHGRTRKQVLALKEASDQPK
jgi:hypothetical protein